jgi:F-type H+-transporting ATPase subunit b
VLVWLLQRFLYKPVRDILEKRRQLATEALAAADTARRQAEAEQHRHEEARGEFAKERQALLDDAHRAIEAERAKRLEEARQEARKLLETAKAELAEERAKTLAGVESEVASVAVALAEKLLDGLGASIASEAFLDRTEAALKTMQEPERRRLERDLAANGAQVTVVTAAPLAAQEQKAWRSRLEGNLGRSLDISFDIDPKLVAGAAVHFPHMVVGFAWADQLKEAKQALLSNKHEKPA